MTWVSKRGIFAPFWLDLKNKLWHPTFFLDFFIPGNYLFGFVSINYLIKSGQRRKNGL